MDRAEQHYRQRLVARSVPAHLHEGLVRYLTAGILPGSFLCSVLENDLEGAVRNADSPSFDGLYALVRFLYHDAPGPAWGSPAKVNSWQQTFRKVGV